MGLSYQDAVALGIGHLYPAASGKSQEPRPSKYHAVRTEYGGVWYSSKAEANRAAYHDHRQELSPAGDYWWIGQPKFRLGVPENVYVTDFLVVSVGLVHVEDVKGHPTAKFKHDLVLWRKYGPCPLWIIMGGKVQIVEGRS